MNRGTSKNDRQPEKKDSLEKSTCEYNIECRYGTEKLENCMIAIIQMKILHNLRKEQSGII